MSSLIMHKGTGKNCAFAGRIGPEWPHFQQSCNETFHLLPAVKIEADLSDGSDFVLDRSMLNHLNQSPTGL